jgi:hypothetical protein
VKNPQQTIYRSFDQDEPDASLLDLVDNVVQQGVVLHGDLLMGLAGVDLIYVQVSLLLAAAERQLRGSLSGGPPGAPPPSKPPKERAARPAPASGRGRGPRRRR